MLLNLKRTETLLFRETNHLTKIRLYACARFGYKHASKNQDAYAGRFSDSEFAMAEVGFAYKSDLAAMRPGGLRNHEGVPL